MIIRPTEIFDDAVEVGKVLHESYKGGIHYEEFSNNTQEEEIEYPTVFLEMYICTNSMQASTLVYDINTNELIGVCLAEKNKDDGTPAEALYFKMGFFPGVQSVAMYKKFE